MLLVGCSTGVPLTPVETFALCQGGSCADAVAWRNEPAIYDSVARFLRANWGQNARLCEADPHTRQCLDEGLSVPLREGLSTGTLRVSHATFERVALLPAVRKVQISVAWGARYDGASRYSCRQGDWDVDLSRVGKALITADDVYCRTKGYGNTLMTAMFDLDFVDTDRAVMGGTYAIGVSGTIFGGRSGYVLMSLPNGVHGPIRDQQPPETTPAQAGAQEPSLDRVQVNPAPR